MPDGRTRKDILTKSATYRHGIRVGLLKGLPIVAQIAAIAVAVVAVEKMQEI